MCCLAPMEIQTSACLLQQQHLVPVKNPEAANRLVYALPMPTWGAAVLQAAHGPAVFAACSASEQGCQKQRSAQSCAGPCTRWQLAQGCAPGPWLSVHRAGQHSYQSTRTTASTASNPARPVHFFLKDVFSSPYMQRGSVCTGCTSSSNPSSCMPKHRRCKKSLTNPLPATALSGCHKNECSSVTVCPAMHFL